MSKLNLISERISDAINKKGYSYGELAAMTNIPKSAIHRYAIGETPKIPLDRIEKMAVALGVSLSYLLGLEESKITVGDRIKELRIKNGLSQIELADKIGSTKQAVYKYEKGIVTNIPFEKIQKLSRALLTTPTYLLGIEENKMQSPIIDKKYKMFKERLNEAMMIREKSAAQLSRETGLSKAQLSQYTNGIYEPKYMAVQKLSDALDVNVAWLIGMDSSMEKRIELQNETELEKEFKLWLPNASDDEKSALLIILKHFNNK